LQFHMKNHSLKKEQQTYLAHNLFNERNRQRLNEIRTKTEIYAYTHTHIYIYTTKEQNTQTRNKRINNN